MAVSPRDAAVPELNLVQDKAGEPSRGESTYWDIDDLQFHCRMGRSTAWRLVKRDDFPKPIVFSPRGVLWPREEVIAFMEQRREPNHYRRCVQTEPSRGCEPAFASRPARRRSG